MNHLFRKRKFINFKSTFTKLILSYILLSFIILIISTFTLYQGYKNQIVEQSNNLYEKLLNQANYYTENTLNWSYSFAYQLYLDDTINKLMYNSIADPANESAGIYKISKASSVVPLTQSIYVYNNNLKKFYSSSGMSYPIDKFYDQNIVSTLKQYNGNPKLAFIPRKFKISSSVSDINILTIILTSTKINDVGLPEGAIILNLNANEIGKYFKDISNENNNLFAINNKGVIILNSNTGTFGQNISNNDYIKKILSSNSSQGHFVMNIDGKTSIVNYMTSEKTDLKYILITPYKLLLESLNKMIKLLIIMFIFIFIIGIPFYYIFSKEIYYPIDKIIKYVKKNLSTNDPVEKNENKNELDYLSSAINQILNTSISLKNLSKYDSLFIKQKIMKDLISNSLNNIKDIENVLSELNIGLQPNNLIVFVLRFDLFKSLNSKYSKEDLKLFLYALENIASEITNTKYNCDAINMETDHISIILNIGDESFSQAVASIIELIEQIQTFIFSSLNFSVSAGIGNFAAGLSDLPKSYRLAYEYTNYRIKYGPNSILYYDKVMTSIKESCKYPEEKEKLLFNDIRSGKIEDIEEHLLSILQELINYRYKDMLLYITELALNSEKLLNSLRKLSHEDIVTNFDFLREDLDEFESISEVKEWLMESYNTTLLQLRKNKDHKKEKLVNKVISYVELNYENPNLSPEYLADYVNLSSNYLRTIFKEIENNSLSNYINKYRFEKSKYLLKHTTLSVSEISSKIGFSNSNYFYTSFKKNFGVSPTEWRKIVEDTDNN